MKGQLLLDNSAWRDWETVRDRLRRYRDLMAEITAAEIWS